MELKTLKYGYYQNYDGGDGSMYDHCTAYSRATKHYTVFAEEDENYYDILDGNKLYKKDAEYGEALVTIQGELLDLLPSCIDDTKDFTLEEIIMLLPRKLLSSSSTTKSVKKKKVL